MNDIGHLKKKRDQLTARIRDAEQREKTKMRKEETRKKIILGASLMSLLKNSDDIMAQRVYNACINIMDDRDRKLFKNSG
ncbi:MAG: hypothetical protein OQL08_07960 [Gammaproteobacteria bacterium]|nr:hypothetical protein [Gammaproteobacteria bacterium]